MVSTSARAIRKSEERGGFEEKCWPQLAEQHADGAESKFDEFPLMHSLSSCSSTMPSLHAEQGFASALTYRSGRRAFVVMH